MIVLYDKNGWCKFHQRFWLFFNQLLFVKNALNQRLIKNPPKRTSSIFSSILYWTGPHGYFRASLPSSIKSCRCEPDALKWRDLSERKHCAFITFLLRARNAVCGDPYGDNARHSVARFDCLLAPPATSASEEAIVIVSYRHGAGVARGGAHLCIRRQQYLVFSSRRLIIFHHCFTGGRTLRGKPFDHLGQL